MLILGEEGTVQIEKNIGVGRKERKHSSMKGLARNKVSFCI